MSDMASRAGDSSGTVMDRRALLRAGGLVAGIAGIAGYATAQAPSAAAATGDPVLAGANNEGGASPTGLTATTWQPTLILDNAGTGVPLRLTPQSEPEFVDSGDLMNIGGDLRFAHADYFVASVYTTLTASQLVPVTPFRAVDTRTAAGRATIVNRAGNLDSAGRLIGGHSIEISLRDHVYGGTAVLANLTVTQPVAGGYLTLWPTGPRPGTSTLNYSAGQVVCNFCVSGLSGLDTVRLYAQRTTHVVLDVVAFAVGNPANVNRPLFTADGSRQAAPAGKPPAWWTSRNG